MPFLEAISSEIYKVVPKVLLSVFEAHEFEMLLNGLSFINVNDWEVNTDYKGVYNATHKNIKWFWQILYEFDQPKLSEFLRFCTGSCRTHIEGFKKLESNRGNFAKFCIESTVYTDKNPFPKGNFRYFNT